MAMQKLMKVLCVMLCVASAARPASALALSLPAAAVDEDGETARGAIAGARLSLADKLMALVWSGTVKNQRIGMTFIIKK